MDRILRDAGGEVDLLTYDSAGALADVDGNNAPTVVVTDSAGTVVPGFTSSRVGAGSYKALLPANLETLDIYDVAWTWPNAQSRASSFELVGGFLFTIAELRAMDSKLADAVAHPSADLVKIREEVEDVFEDPNVTNVAFRPRGRRDILNGAGNDTLILTANHIRRVVSLKVDGVALTSPEIAALKVFAGGRIRKVSGIWFSGVANVEVLYEHGLPQVPATVRKAAMKLARYEILKGPLEDERATAVFTDIGGARLSLAGRDGETGLPEVDQVLRRYDWRMGFA